MAEFLQILSIIFRTVKKTDQPYLGFTRKGVFSITTDIKRQRIFYLKLF